VVLDVIVEIKLSVDVFAESGVDDENIMLAVESIADVDLSDSLENVWEFVVTVEAKLPVVDCIELSEVETKFVE
jgi:hypothetical protein